MNKDKVYLKGYVIGRAADTLGYQGLMVQLENLDIVEIDKNLVHRDINRPQKVKIPQFVADWIEEGKKHCKDVSDLFDFDFTNEEVGNWFLQEKPFDLVARAWINGYEVEKEKRYYIRLKNVDENYNYLTCIKHLDAWALTEIKRDKKFRTEHTKKQLEEGGFGEVFDSPLFEVEEVEA